MKMEDLTTLLPQPNVVTSPEVFQQIGAITRMLHDTMQQLGVMPRLKKRCRRPARYPQPCELHR